MSGSLVNGVKEGEWGIYSKAGRLIRVEVFSSGEITNTYIR